MALAVSLWIGGSSVAWAENSGGTKEGDTYRGTNWLENNVVVYDTDISGIYHVEGTRGVDDNLTATNNKVTIDGDVDLSHGHVAGAYLHGHGVHADGNTVIINSGTINDVYGGYALGGGEVASTASGNTVSINGGTIRDSVVGGYFRNGGTAEGNIVELNGATIQGSVYGGFKAYSTGTLTCSGNKLFLSGVNTIGGTVGNFEAIKLKDTLAWDTTTVLTANKFTNYGTLDITAATTLVNHTALGTMTLLSSNTAGDFSNLKLAYNATTQTKPVTLSSTTNISQVVKAGTAKTSLDKGITIAYNENEHTVSLDVANSYKNVNYTIANNVKSITFGEMTWGTPRALTAGDFDFSGITNGKINLSGLKFTNPGSLTGSTTLLTGATGLAAGTNIAHSQTFDQTAANGAKLTATLSGNVIRTTAAEISYTTTGTALDSVNLTGWDGSTSSVPTGWAAKTGGVAVTAAGFTEPSLSAGQSVDILTTDTESFFGTVTGAKAYTSEALTNDKVNGVTLSGNHYGGVKAEDSGKKLTYYAETMGVTGIFLGEMAWGTWRTANAAGYVYTGATVDASNLSFKNPQNITAGSTTLLTANNTLTDITATTKNVSYSAVPIAGVTLDGVINGSYASTSGVLSYTATANNATKLTFGNVEWKDSGALLTRPANITFAGAAVDTSNINFTNIQELEANKKMTLVSDFGDSVGTITGTKYKVGSTLQGEGTASLIDSNEDGTLDALIFTANTTAEKMEAQEQTHNTVMGATASMAALSAGNDFVGAASDGLSLGSNTGADGVATFAQMGGGSMRQETGSHVTSHMWNAILALGHQNEKKSGTTEYGAFFEYGTGNYTTFNGDIRGDGSMHYTGGGLLGKWTSPKKDYIEGSIRLGNIKDDASNVLTDEAGNTYGYNTSTGYYGFHVGYGKIFDYSGGRSLDVYGKFFYNHRNGVSFDAGGHYDLDAVNSQILRLGARYSMKTSDQWKWYSGLAYEYEFGGEATGRADGVAIRGASTKGGSLRAEVGATITQADSPWTVDLNLTAFAGKKRGLTGGVGLKYNF